MDRRGLLKLTAAGGASVVATVVNAAAVNEEVQVNRRHRIKVGEIIGLEAVHLDDPDGTGWLNIETIRGHTQTELVCKPDPLCPVDPRALYARLSKLTGIYNEVIPYGKIKVKTGPDRYEWVNFEDWRKS